WKRLGLRLIEGDPRALAGGQAGVGDRRAEGLERGVVDGRGAVSTGEVLPAAGVEEAELLRAQPALRHEVALARLRAALQQRDARRRDGPVRGGERHLLPDDGGEVRVEREHERLDLPPLRVARGVEREAVGARGRREARVAVEAEDRIDAPVVYEAEAPHLIARERERV